MASKSVNKQVAELPAKAKSPQQQANPKLLQAKQQQQNNEFETYIKNASLKQTVDKNPTPQSPQTNKQKPVVQTHQLDQVKANLKQKQDEYFEDLKNKVDQDDMYNMAEAKVERKTNKIYQHLQNGTINIHGQSYRKTEMIEDNIIEKKIIESQKLKDQLQAQISNLEVRLDNLQSQKIDNPKSLYSHPVLKQYLDNDDDRKKQQASNFLRRLKKKQDDYKEKLNKKRDEMENKRKIEEQKVNKISKIQKQNDEKEKEDRFKQKLLFIKQRQEQRVKEINEFEDIYFRKIKKDSSKRPLYQRFSRKYNNEEKEFREQKLKEMREQKKSFTHVAQIDFKQHEKNYFENLKKLQEEKRQNREKMIQSLTSKQPAPNLVYDSSKLLKFEITNNFYKEKQEEERAEKENGYRTVEARNKFSQALKTHQQVNVSKSKQFEMEVLIDKQTNPTKYLSLVKRKTESERYQEFIDKGKFVRKNSADVFGSHSSSSMSVYTAKTFQTPQAKTKKLVSQGDEEIFKEKIKIGFQKQEPGKEKEIGKQYLKSIRESSRKYMEYLKSRQSQTDQVEDDQVIQEQMSNTEQNALRGSFTPQSSVQKSPSEDRLSLPKIVKKDRSRQFYNSFSNNNSKISYQQDEQFNKNLNEDKYYSSSNTSMNVQKKKPNYMEEVRQKYHFEGRKEQWEKLNDQNVTLPIITKKKLLEEASNKYDEDIKKKQQLIRSHKSNGLSLREVEDRQNLDDAYLKSIKAKIEMMKLTIENDEFVKKPEDPQRKYMHQKSQESS